MTKSNNPKTKESHRFSLRWQLPLGMALVFFLTCGLFVTIIIMVIQRHYGDLPHRLSQWMWLLTAIGAGVVFLFAFWLTKIVILPVTKIEKIIQSFEDDPMTEERVPAKKTNDELSDLGRILNRMIDRLQRLISAQQQFVSDVSHELRTPVAIVKGHMEMLNRWGKDDPEVLADSIQSSLAETKRMETLINEMLNLTRAEQVPVENVTQLTDVGGIVRRIFSEFKMLHPDFILTLDDDLKDPAVVNIRQDHLEQIIIILADNAVKYSTKRQEIHFALSKSATRVEIGIQDFGEGIASGDLPHVFDRFYRVDKARSRQKGGNGLGLSIAQRLVEAYGGDIAVESAVGSGSIFTVHLPLATKKIDSK